jgi:hypothetical protein
LICCPNIQAAIAGSKQERVADKRGASPSEARAAYGILQFIMRHTYVLIAILGVCFAASGQAAKQQPKPKPPAASATPAQPQRPSDEELMAKTAQATIDWDSSTTKGAKVEVLLIKKEQAESKPVMQYHLKVSGAPTNKLYTLMAWPITIAQPATMMDGLAMAPWGARRIPTGTARNA